MPSGERICEQCGEPVHGHSRRRFCSESCRKKAKRRRQAKTGDLPPSRVNAAATKRAWLERKRQARPAQVEAPPALPLKSDPVEVQCAFCPGKFLKKRSTQRFCSARCRKAAKGLYKKRTRRWAAKDTRSGPLW